MPLPQYLMGQNQFDTAPLENALWKFAQHQEQQRQNAFRQQQMDMEQERLGFERTRFQDDRTRKDELGRILDPTNQSFRDVPPQLVEISRAMRDPSPIVQHYVNSQKGTDDIKEFEYAKRQGFVGQFQDWMAIKKRGAEEEFNKNLVYGTDARGNIVPMQAGTKGNLVASKLPPGVALQRDPIKFDAGTHYILLDPTTRQPIGQVQKNVAAVEEQKAVGEARGRAVVDLPRVIDNAQQAIDTISKIREHPGYKAGVGIWGIAPPIPGTAQAGFVDLVNQAKGKAFLEAFNSLRGGGAITEAEGTKGTQAISRLERARRPEDFEAALTDLETVINAGLVRSYRNAGIRPGQGPTIETTPQGGSAPPAPVYAPPQPLDPKQVEIPPRAIQFLQQNPTAEMIQAFDKKYGEGSAKRYLRMP